MEKEIKDLLGYKMELPPPFLPFTFKGRIKKITKGGNCSHFIPQFLIFDCKLEFYRNMYSDDMYFSTLEDAQEAYNYYMEYMNRKKGDSVEYIDMGKWDKKE